ncbi:MAG: DUF3883 domain-containing protein [Brevundimonas sp.]|uniref:DUF3883 domain-containing protein n=1 Tax=Brevundimonas sp. TaxID=1871086 RepID=UPI00256DE1D3|nr:DUF3883 domain-containing protein [Brevundimonas sp.]MDK2747000.1 DUF3883 domain-containing protein [Brevundimonas sp.]
MADNGKHGRDWDDEELDLIVADYFAMLDAATSGRPLVKAHHAQALSRQIGRTIGSVGQKYGNISTVLTELGMPKLNGFGNRPNYQGAIFLALERYLDRNPAAWDIGMSMVEPVLTPPAQSPSYGSGVSEPATRFAPVPLLMTPPPPRGADGPKRPAGLARLVRKFDPAARDERNRKLGRIGEERIFLHERAQLIALDRADLARKVEWTSEERGDGAGYDIRSFNPADGRERLIEVKATRGGASTDFFLTRTECEVAQERPDAWRLYRVHSLPVRPEFFVLAPPLEGAVVLTPEAWRASF